MIVSNYIATLNDVEVGRCPHEMNSVVYDTLSFFKWFAAGDMSNV